MKLQKPLYNVLQHLSTIDDVLAYNGNNILVMQNKVGSDFVEVEVTDFFKEKLIIRSLSKFLRLFTFGKGKNDTNESIQDWTLSEEHNAITNSSIAIMYLKMPGRTIKLQQGHQRFLTEREDKLHARFDNIALSNSVKFQITHQTYKQIISDCSLLDLDSITIASESSSKISIHLSKKDTKGYEDYSTFMIDCEHEHIQTSISILLSAFNLIEATDHQLEFGTYTTPDGYEVPMLKIKSFCDNNYVVKKVIIGYKGKK